MHFDTVAVTAFTVWLAAFIAINNSLNFRITATIAASSRAPVVRRLQVRRLLQDTQDEDQRQEFNAAVGHGVLFKGKGLIEGSKVEDQSSKDDGVEYVDRSR